MQLLDTKDIKILRELLIDGRTPASKIAKKVKLSREVVEYRIKRFLDRKIIENFGVVLDETKRGYSLTQVLLSIKIKNKEDEKKTITYLKNHDFTVWVVKCGGKFNFVIEVFAKDIGHLDFIINNLAAKFGDKLRNYEAFTVSYQYKYTHGVGLLSKGLKVTGEQFESKYLNEKIRLDDVDRAILKLLNENGRRSLVSIGKEIQLGADAVNSRIKKLKKLNVLKGIVPHIDLLKLGLQKYIVLLHLKNVQMNSNPLKSFMQNHKYVRYCVRHIGKMQIYAIMYADSTEHFHELLEELKFKHNDIIDEVQFFPVFKRYKEDLLPKGVQ